MSNMGTVRVRNSLALPRYYKLVQKVVGETYGDALNLDFNPTNRDINQSGICIKTDEGHFLCQLFLWSTRRIVADHRRGEVGYMVADVLLQRLARELNGVWTEDAVEGAMDLDTDRPLYFVDRVRQTYGDHVNDAMRLYQKVRPLYFTGKFARYWEKG